MLLQRMVFSLAAESRLHKWHVLFCVWKIVETLPSRHCASQVLENTLRLTAAWSYSPPPTRRFFLMHCFLAWAPTRVRFKRMLKDYYSAEQHTSWSPLLLLLQGPLACLDIVGSRSFLSSLAVMVSVSDVECCWRETNVREKLEEGKHQNSWGIGAMQPPCQTSWGTGLAHWFCSSPLQSPDCGWWLWRILILGPPHLLCVCWVYTPAPSLSSPLLLLFFLQSKLMIRVTRCVCWYFAMNCGPSHMYASM